MQVVLINPPWYFKEKVEFMPQNLGLGYLASLLIKNKHDVVMIDALREGWWQKELVHTKYQDVYRFGLPYSDILARIPINTELIGITTPFTDSAQMVKELASVIKIKYPKSKIVVGGVGPSTIDMKTDSIDYIIEGEGEIPMLNLARGLPPGNDIIQDLDSLPYPIRNNDYSWSPRGNKDKRTLSLITSRGCPFDCNFCSIHNSHGYEWRARSPDNIVDEIMREVLYNEVNHLEFEDDNLTLNRDRALELFYKIKSIRDVRPWTWSAPNGVMIETLDKKLLQAIKESGCESINLAVESGSKEMLDIMNKRVNLGKVEEVVRDCSTLGIYTSAFFILGYPGETKNRYRESLKFARHLLGLGLSAVSPLVATPYPKTKLFKLCEDNNYLVYPDQENVLIQASYANYRPEFVQIETPDFTKEEVFDRLKRFQKLGAKYNVYGASK